VVRSANQRNSNAANYGISCIKTQVRGANHDFSDSLLHAHLNSLCANHKNRADTITTTKRPASQGGETKVVRETPTICARRARLDVRAALAKIKRESFVSDELMGCVPLALRVFYYADGDHLQNWRDRQMTED
jgi:hypothetical protein